MTTANKITIFRILLVPFFIVLVLYYVQDGTEIFRVSAILTFAVATVSDGLDGFIARRYHQHSDLGRVLDPLADKLLLVSGVILLSLKNEPFLPRIPLWLTVTILSRDALVLLGMIVIHYACGRVMVRAALIGKAATVLQMTCVLWALLKWNATWLLIWSLGATLSTAVSGVIYVFDGVRQLNASPSSSPAPHHTM